MHPLKTRFLIPALAAVALSGTSALASTIDVTPSNMNGWFFDNTDNSGHNASGGFVLGPGSPPLGTGSANLIVGDTSSSERLEQIFGGPTSLSTFTTLSYATYVTTSTPGSGAAPTLQFDLYQGAAYQGRLVFDPGLLGGVVTGAWQTWDAFADPAWYFSRPSLVTADGGHCSIGGDYCSLTAAAAFLDSQQIFAVTNLFKAGGDQASFNGNVDAYVRNDTTFNFDPDATTAVPEPMTLSLFGGGLAAGAWLRRRKVKKA